MSRYSDCGCGIIGTSKRTKCEKCGIYCSGK